MWGCFTMPNYTRERWNDIFGSNRASQEESYSTHFSFLFPFPYIREAGQWTDRFVKNRAANFGLTGSTEGDPEYSARKKPKWTFPFVSNRNFRNLWHNGKHLRSSSAGALRHGKWGDGKFSSLFLFLPIRQIRKDILSHGGYKQGKRKCRDSVTFS